MSITSLLMPAITQRLLSAERLSKKRADAERLRVARGQRHQVHYFHQADDPYSALAGATLARLLERYDIELMAHVVPPPGDNAAPERERLVAYSRKDATLLARHWGLEFHDTATQPPPEAVALAQRVLVAAVAAGRFAEVAGPLSVGLWSDAARLAELALPGGPLAPAEAAACAAHLASSDALRQRLGHYLGAMFFYGGEWYWGLDRLYHLEQRLQQLGAQRSGAPDLMFPPSVDLQQPVRLDAPPAIDFFVSLRSPYSAIVTPRVFALGRLTGAPVRLRYVLPMAMRGLPVPREKRSYISLDAAREARCRGIPFGRLNDPLGRPTERGLALIPMAERAGKGQDYLSSFMRGVWSEGIDAGSDRGLRKIVERAGLAWDEARPALADDSWRATAEHNRAEMFALGLWGVPSFHVAGVAVWGQDRLWAVQEALLAIGRAAAGDKPARRKP